ncbi:MAG TPA: methyltransferase [Vicinamibacterales bacterium]|nr:methyltransferase [Vicinamibacterales bacterium]
MPVRPLQYTAVMSCAGSSGDQPQLASWLRAAEERYLADLTFAEVTRALRALSSCYVERRARLAQGAALDGAGKRAAFALFYAPLHALVTLRIVEAIGARLQSRTTLVDLGCGTGAASGAWALAAGASVSIEGVDRSAWAVREASWTWRTLGVRGRATRADVTRARTPRGPAAWLAAFTANELSCDAGQELRDTMVAASVAGQAILVIEPLAGAVTPWWDDWADAFRRVGGRRDEWRFPGLLPDIVARFDRAAGLRHQELTARTIYVPQRTTM